MKEGYNMLQDDYNKGGCKIKRFNPASALFYSKETDETENAANPDKEDKTEHIDNPDTAKL